MNRETLEINGKEVTLVGTAHVSEESVNDVEEVMEEIRPDYVGVELDADRLESLRDRDGWRDLDVKQAMRDGKGSMLLMNLLMSIYQRKLGLSEGIEPGSEMLRAVEIAEEEDIEFGLIDQDIQTTLQRLREELGLWDKFRLLSSIIFEKTEMDVEDLKQQDMLSSIVSELERDFPALKQVLLDERNNYMAEKIREAEFEKGVVFVGAAHVQGLAEELREPSRLGGSEPGFSFPWLKTAKYGFPVFIIGMLAYSFLKIGFSTGVKATSFWILSNGILAMLGAIAARSNPLTWLVSFISAPLTSLDPALGAGMVAGYFEAKFYPPSVEELEQIVYLENYSDLWHNQVGRILLTFIFVTIGSATATFLSAGYIASMISTL